MAVVVAVVAVDGGGGNRSLSEDYLFDRCGCCIPGVRCNTVSSRAIVNLVHAAAPEECRHTCRILLKLLKPCDNYLTHSRSVLKQTPCTLAAINHEFTGNSVHDGNLYRKGLACQCHEPGQAIGLIFRRQRAHQVSSVARYSVTVGELSSRPSAMSLHNTYCVDTGKISRHLTRWAWTARMSERSTMYSKYVASIVQPVNARAD